MRKSTLAITVCALALAWSMAAVTQEAEPAAEAEHHAHAAPRVAHDPEHGPAHGSAHGSAHAAAPLPAEGQRWATDAPLREAMLRIRDGVAVNATGFHDGTLSAAAAQTLAAAVEGDVQFMIANCRLAPEPDAALHALIGRMLGAAEALRDDPLSAGGLPQLESVLDDYGATFDHPGWTPQEP
jgi:hypothetical protein